MDEAGNAATATVSGINIDKTPPTPGFGAPSPTPNAAGWYNADVTIPLTVNDSLSGGVPAPPLLLTAEGPAVSASVKLFDRAGNSATFTSPQVRIDKTPPQVTFSGNRGTYTVEQQVQITRAFKDTLSGVVTTGGADLEAPAYTLGLGFHRLTATATDGAGNTGTGVTSYTVAVTYDSLMRLTQQFTVAGRQDQAVYMNAPLAAAKAADAKGDSAGKAQAIAAYITRVTNRRMTFLVKSEDADILIALAHGL